MGSRERTEHIAIVGLERSLLGTYQDVMILEAQGLGLAVERHALLHVLGSHVVVAPVEENHRIDEERQHEVDQHTTYHDEQSLPGWLGAELPGLLGLFHLLGIETLVDHTRNLAVTA